MNRVTRKQTQLCTHFSEPPNHLCAINSSRHFPSEKAAQCQGGWEAPWVMNSTKKTDRGGAGHVYSHMHLAQTAASSVKRLKTLFPKEPQEAAVSQELSSTLTSGFTGTRVPYI